jgi:hypothetical protein
MIAQGAANGVHGFLVQRLFAGYSTNAVRAKEFSHDLSS